MPVRILLIIKVIACFWHNMGMTMSEEKVYLDNTTLCLTIGKRPDELRQSLNSLLSKVGFKHIIAINDFGDEETNQVFKELCPNGELISLGYNLGHHKAVDLMYSKVCTPYIFHSEDDWLFDDIPNFDNLFQLLNNNQNIVSVCFRKISDIPLNKTELSAINYRTIDNVEIADLSNVHPQWYGYTFNPHLLKIQTYQTIAPFAKYKKERHISRTFKGGGNNFVAYLKNGYCHHIGLISIANPPKTTFWQKIKGKLF